MKNDVSQSIEVPCPLCGEQNYSLYVMAPSHYGPEKYSVTKCQACSMVFTNPQKVTYYEEVHNRGVLPTHLTAHRLSNSINQAKLQLELISQFSRAGSLLDFGSGGGALVATARQKGWDAIGIDLNEGLVEAANKHWNFNYLRCCSLEQFSGETTTKFDVIVSNQVFEHLQKPISIGKSLCQMLKAGGYILIDVPNLRQPREWLNKGQTLDPTSHWSHFSRETLRELVKRIGCEPVYVNASPSFVNLYCKMKVPMAIKLARIMKGLMPPVGSGVCVIGRKTS